MMRRVFTDEQEAEIARRYAAGESSVQLARALGSNHSTMLDAISRQGLERRPAGARAGALAPKWGGGRHVMRTGYVRVWIAPDEFPEMRRHANRCYVLEHRLVMARHLGRPLERHEQVHHRNGDRSDNRIENLELRVGSHGTGATAPHCPTCTCFS